MPLGTRSLVCRRIEQDKRALTSWMKCLMWLNGPTRPLKRATGAIEFRGVDFATTTNIWCCMGCHLRWRRDTSGDRWQNRSQEHLMSLLMRFYDPSQGQIFLDGVDLRDYKLADRNRLALSCRNLCCSRRASLKILRMVARASFQDIVTAAKVANAHDFLGTAQWVATPFVGERGMRLSGGERQRIALARAFRRTRPYHSLMSQPVIDGPPRCSSWEGCNGVMAAGRPHDCPSSQHADVCDAYRDRTRPPGEATGTFMSMCHSL